MFLFLIDLLVVVVFGLLLAWLIPKIVSKLSNSRFKEFWTTRSFWRRLAINQIVGLSLLCLIMFSSPFISYVMELEETALDFLMEVYSGDIPPREEKNIPSFVLLDIDDETYKRWEEPLNTPRDKLKNLIDVAVQAGARLIIVDIDLSQVIEGDKKSQELKKYLMDYGDGPCENQSGDCPPIILVRAFSQFVRGSVPAEPRLSSFLEDVVQSNPYVQWGSAQFGVSNNSMRRWRLWEPSCINQQPKVIPSIALLALGEIRKCSEDIQSALQSLKPENCSEGNEFFSNTHQSISVCSLTMSANTQSIEQRVMYRIPWSDDRLPPELPRVVHDNDNVEIVTMLSAYSYAESPSEINLEKRKMLTDSIVVIGGSYGYNTQRGSDVSVTPIGEMPGALIIINAIHSLLQDITIKPISPFLLQLVIWIVVTAFFLTVVTVFSYVSFESSWGNLVWKISGGIIILGFFGILFYESIMVFQDGTWLNIAILLLIIQAYEYISQKTWLKKIFIQ